MIELEKVFEYDKSNLEDQIEVAEKNWKQQNKALKVKDKELHDLKKKTEQIA